VIERFGDFVYYDVAVERGRAVRWVPVQCTLGAIGQRVIPVELEIGCLACFSRSFL